MEKYPCRLRWWRSQRRVFREVHPDSGTTPTRRQPRYYKFVGDHGVQFVANRFYINDAALRDELLRQF
jgi:hypothetical protein